MKKGRPVKENRARFTLHLDKELISNLKIIAKYKRSAVCDIIESLLTSYVNENIIVINDVKCLVIEKNK